MRLQNLSGSILLRIIQNVITVISNQKLLVSVLFALLFIADRNCCGGQSIAAFTVIFVGVMQGYRFQEHSQFAIVP